MNKYYVWESQLGPHAYGHPFFGLWPSGSPHACELRSASRTKDLYLHGGILAVDAKTLHDAVHATPRKIYSKT